MTASTPDQPSKDQLRQMALGRWENEGGAEMPAALPERTDVGTGDDEPTRTALEQALR